MAYVLHRKNTVLEPRTESTWFMRLFKAGGHTKQGTGETTTAKCTKREMMDTAAR